jgi:hypothetical protein
MIWGRGLNLSCSGQSPMQTLVNKLTKLQN